jgi:putative phosphoesterase
MRFAIISDVHGNYAALEAVLADIKRRGVDTVLGLGDFVSGPFDPGAVASRLIDEQVPVVRGNHDRLVVEPRDKDWAVDVWVRGRLADAHADWLRRMPATHVVEGEVFMCHGTPASDVEFWMDRYDDVHGVVATPRDHVETAAAGRDFPVLLCGHTHIARTLRLADGRLLVNPGSVGLPFMLGSPDARYAVIERHNGRWSCDLVAIPYDRTPATEQARTNGFPGFAMAIETGWASIHDL